MSKPSTDLRRPWRLCTALLATLCALFSRAGGAETTRRTHTLVVGQKLLSVSGEGLDESGTGTAAWRFPEHPVVRAHTRLAGGIGQAPASDAAGDLILTHAEPRLSKLAPEGRELWSRRLAAEAMAPPIITTAGSIVVITLKGDSILFSKDGTEVESHALPLSDPRRHALAIPLAHGGVAVASGSEIIELDATGAVTRQGHAKSTLVALAQSGTSLLAIADNGAISEAKATGDFEHIGSFAGAVAEGVAARNGALVAVVDGHKLVTFDLHTRTARMLAGDFAGTWSGPPLAFARGGFALVADGAFVSSYAANGTEAQRVSLLEGRTFDPALRALRPARIIGDGEQGIVAVRSGSDAFLLGSDGHAQRLEDTACLDPFRPTPTPHGLVLACRSGQLFIVADKTP